MEQPCRSCLKIAGLIHSRFTDVNYADSGLFHYQKRMVWRMEENLAFVVSAVIGLPVFLVLYFVFFGAEYQKPVLFSVFNTAGSSYQINMARNR